MENHPISKQPELSFQPVHEGLGFHPFSDGMPYAPVSKSVAQSAQSYSRGTGAVAAGQPKFLDSGSHKMGAAPKVFVPVVHVRGGSGMKSNHKREGFTGDTSMAKLKAPLVQGQSQGLHAVLEEELGSFYRSRRCCAFLLDFFFNSLVMGMGLGWIIWFHEVDTQVFMNPEALGTALVVLSLLNWFLVTLQEVTFRTSLGKYFFHLILPGNRFQILLRSLLFLPGVLFGGLGLIWSLLDSKKCCLHDRWVGVQPKELSLSE